jgi:RNA polymerase sigma factor (sigma-70 family)
MVDNADEYLPTRASLLSRLKDWDDQQSWQQFYDAYWRLIHGAALKAGLTKEEAEDVLQETVLSVARKIQELKYDPARGSFKGWLMTLTQWRVTDQLRRRQRRVARIKEDTGKTDLVEQLPDPAAAEAVARVWEGEWERNLLAVALERVKGQIAPRHFQIYQLYVQREWPISRVAKTLGVSSALIYVTKHRVASLLKKEIRRLQQSFW